VLGSIQPGSENPDNIKGKGPPAPAKESAETTLIRKLEAGDANTINALTSLNPESAAALARSKVPQLFLGRVQVLTAPTAQALAQYKGFALVLAGLKYLDVETATALGQSKAKNLSLFFGTTIKAQALLKLSAFRGLSLTIAGRPLTPPQLSALNNFRGPVLHLGCVRVLDKISAKVISQMKTAGLSFPNLKSLTPEAAIQLGNFSGNKLGFPGLLTLSGEAARSLNAR
jgi:hypothetical protein